MTLESYLGDLSFNLLGPHARRTRDFHFHVQRTDGSAVTLLDHGPFALELGNTRLPPDGPHRDPAFRELASMPKMSTVTIGSILNEAVAQMSADDAFVNVGVWYGFTILSGLHGNPDARAIGIDNFSLEIGAPRDEFLRRFRQRSTDRQEFIEGDYREVLADGFADSIGVYLYDGHHSYEDQFDGLKLAEPFFAEGCVVVVDDSSWTAPREATLDFVEQSSREYSILLDVSTAGSHPTLWNGLLVLRANAGHDVAPLTEIPAPKLTPADPPVSPSNQVVTVLIDARPGYSAVAATLRAMRSQSHADLELFTFGPAAPGASDVDHHSSAVEALNAGRGAHALIVEAGVEPAEDTVASALLWATECRESPPPIERLVFKQ